MRRKAYRTIKLGPQDHLQLKISRSGDELHLQTSYCVEIWDKKASSGAEQRHFKEHIPTYYDTQNHRQRCNQWISRQERKRQKKMIPREEWRKIRKEPQDAVKAKNKVRPKCEYCDQPGRTKSECRTLKSVIVEPKKETQRIHDRCPGWSRRRQRRIIRGDVSTLN